MKNISYLIVASAIAAAPIAAGATSLDPAFANPGGEVRPSTVRAFRATSSAMAESIAEEERGSIGRVLFQRFELAPSSETLETCRSRDMSTQVAVVQYRSERNVVLREAQFDVCVPRSSQLTALMVGLKEGSIRNLESPDAVRAITVAPMTRGHSSGNCDLFETYTVGVCLDTPEVEIVAAGPVTWSGSSRSQVTAVTADPQRKYCVNVTYQLGGPGTVDRGFGIRDCSRGGPSISFTVPVVTLIRTAR